MKKILIIIMSIMFLNLVSAYECFILEEGQMDCDKTMCRYCYDNNLTIVNNKYCYNVQCKPFEIEIENNLNIISPKDSSVYSSRSILLELTSNKPSSFYYGKNGDGRLIRLSRNVTKYNKKMSFSEGLNNITIKSVDIEGNSLNKNINILVDSKQPLIRTYTRSKIINGSFAIKFQEDNVKFVRIIINNNSKEINLDFCKKERSYFVCSFFVDISEFNCNNVTYYFEVEDIANNKDETTKTKAKVDCNRLMAHTMNLKGGIENE